MTERIEDAIAQTGAKLMIIDPIQAFMGPDADWNNAVKIRHMLRNLSSTAQKYNCAVVMVGHLNKMTGGKNLYRGLGSIDIAAIARSVLMISRTRKNPQRGICILSRAVLPQKAVQSVLNWEKTAVFDGSVNVKSILMSCYSKTQAVLRKRKRQQNI